MLHNSMSLVRSVPWTFPFLSAYFSGPFAGPTVRVNRSLDEEAGLQHLLRGHPGLFLVYCAGFKTLGKRMSSCRLLQFVISFCHECVNCVVVTEK